VWFDRRTAGVASGASGGSAVGSGPCRWPLVACYRTHRIVGDELPTLAR